MIGPDLGRGPIMQGIGLCRVSGYAGYRVMQGIGRFGGPGGDLLFRVLRRSTIGAEGFHGRVRDGIGCMAPRHDHQVVGTEVGGQRSENRSNFFCPLISVLRAMSAVVRCRGSVSRSDRESGHCMRRKVWIKPNE